MVLPRPHCDDATLSAGGPSLDISGTRRCDVAQASCREASGQPTAMAHAEEGPLRRYHSLRLPQLAAVPRRLSLSMKIALKRQQSALSEDDASAAGAATGAGTKRAQPASRLVPVAAASKSPVARPPLQRAAASVISGSSRQPSSCAPVAEHQQQQHASNAAGLHVADNAASAACAFKQHNGSSGSYAALCRAAIDVRSCYPGPTTVPTATAPALLPKPAVRSAKLLNGDSTGEEYWQRDAASDDGEITAFRLPVWLCLACPSTLYTLRLHLCTQIYCRIHLVRARERCHRC